MPELPSPAASRLRSPRWFDGRLALGVLLLLVSVVVGAKLVASAHTSSAIYVARGSFAAGTRLGAADVAVGRVRLFGGADRYIDAGGPSPVGRTLTRSVAAGELLPVAALAAPDGTPPGRLVTVPVSHLHAPPGLDHGSLVDLFATYTEPGQPSRTVTVLRGVPVEGRTKAAGALSSAGADVGLVLRVPPEQAAAVVSAVEAAKVDVVQLERSSSASGDVAAGATAPTGTAPAPAVTPSAGQSP